MPAALTLAPCAAAPLARRAGAAAPRRAVALVVRADAGDKLKSGVEKLKDAVAGKLKEVQHDNLEAHKHTPNDEGFEWSPMEAEESPARKADKKRMMDLQKEQHGSAGD